MNRLSEAIAAEPSMKVIQVAKEDEAIGICCGAFMGGVNACLLMANAGFMTTCYPLATLSMYHRIPMFMLINDRGTLGDVARYQEYQGLLTSKMLQAMDVPNWTVDKPEETPAISNAFRYSRAYKRPVAVLLRAGVWD
jgi:sulfopyruvate decarboxylase subunit alpha